MNRKERILAYMKSEGYIPMTFSELCTVLDVPKDADAEFLEILTELEEDEKIVVTKKGRYVALKKDLFGLAVTTNRAVCSVRFIFSCILSSKFQVLFRCPHQLGVCPSLCRSNIRLCRFA